MRKIMPICVMIFTCTTILHAQKYQEWYKPFSSNGSGEEIYRTFGKGNRIWYLSEFGFGSFNTVTREIDYTLYSKFDLPALGTDYMMSIGDSDRVALYGIWGKFIRLFDGERWTNLPLPEGENWNSTPGASGTQLFIDNSGDIWTITGRSEIARYRNNTWTSTPLTLPDSIFVSSIVADRNGTVWLLGSYNVIIEDTRITGTRSYLYSLKNGTLSQISEIPVRCRYLDYADTTILIIADSEDEIPFDRTISVVDPTGSIRLLRDKIKGVRNRSDVTLDTDGNLWYIENDTTLVKCDSRTSAILLSVTISRDHLQLMSCDNGIYYWESWLDTAAQKSCEGFTRFALDDTMYTRPSTGLWDAACTPPSGALLFRKDSSFVSWPALGFSFIGGSNTITSYKNGICSPLPTPDFEITGMWELDDGTLVLARDLGGLYYLDSETWELFEGTESIFCFSVVQDAAGFIWATTNTSIIKQTGSGWELINESNSDLPPFGSPEIYGINKLIKDRNDVIWLLAEGSLFIARTTDGYHWTIFDTTNSNVFSEFPKKQPSMAESTLDGNLLISEQGENFIGMALNGSGAVEIDYTDKTKCSDSSCGNIITVTYNGTGSWDIRRIPFPAMPDPKYPYPLFLRTRRDSKGGFWFLNTDENDDCAVYHNLQGSSTWKRYGPPDNPYEIIRYHGEDSEGRTYFHAAPSKPGEWELVIFSPGSGGVDPNPVIELPHHVRKQMPFAARLLSPGRVMVSFSLSKITPVQITLLSLDGKRVAQLHKGRLMAGNHLKTFSVASARGVYLVRLQTPDNVRAARLFIR